VPALQPYFFEPIFEQFCALLPERKVDHPLGCHRPRIPDEVIFEKLVQVLVFGCAYWRIADESCSATTLRRRRDEWIEIGVMEALWRNWRAKPTIRPSVSIFSMWGRRLLHHQGSVWRRESGKKPGGQGKRAGPQTLDGGGCAGDPSWGSGRWGQPPHDSPLLAPTLEAVEVSIELPEDASVHLDRAYDSKVTRELLEDRRLVGMISEKGAPAPLQATKRWVVERTNSSWSNAHKKLVWCTEREGRVIDFWIAFSNAIIIVGRLIREAWSRYRWESRPVRRP